MKSFNYFYNNVKPTFTLAEVFSHSDNHRKVAFTLAEVLITLGIIGVVAALTLPLLITNVQSKIRTARIENIEQKLNQATDEMNALEGVAPYTSTTEFVNVLQKHLKLAKYVNRTI